MKLFSRILNFFKSRKKSVSVMFSVAVAVLGGGYILAHLLGVFSEKLDITPATIATEELYEVADSYIFRDEHVVETDYSGFRLDLVSDGELVGIGTEYARIYAESIDEALELELREIDRATHLYSKCLVDLAPSEVKRYQERRSELYKSITDALSRGQLASVGESHDEIIEIYSTLALYLGKEDGEVKENLAQLESTVEALKARKDEIIASLGGNYQSLVAEKTGYYYSGTDGRETTMSSRGIKSKSLSEIMGAIDSLSNEVQPTGQGRLVYDPNWYAVVVMDMQDAVKYIRADGGTRVGTYSVGFYDGEWNDMEMTLEKVVRSPDDKRAVLLFSSSDMTMGFEDGRYRQVRIHTDKHSGYKVPMKALRTDAEGQEGVYVLVSGTVEWKKTEVIYRDPEGTFVLVKQVPIDQEDADEWLALNDSLIIGGKNLYDGKTVD